MTWTRLDDTWTDLPELAELPLEARWHYLCMIQFCSRTKRYDGVLKVADARRCSDVDDPVAAMALLTTAGLLSNGQPGHVKVQRIEDHIPPPSVRDASEKTKVRMARSRRHKNGDHSECLPGNCPHVSINEKTGEVQVTRDVTRNTRTGQDRTGRVQGGTSFSPSQELGDDGWPLEECASCHEPMQNYEPGWTTHPTCPPVNDLTERKSA